MVVSFSHRVCQSRSSAWYNEIMLRKKIVDDQIAALKKHDQEKLSFLSYILAQIKYKEIEKSPSGGGELNDEETITVLRRIAKELHESIEAFRKGKRADLVSVYQKQLDIVSTYLPKEMSDADLKKEIEKVIAEYNKNLPAGRQDPKALIGICVSKLKSKSESSRIVRLLQSMVKL